MKTITFNHITRFLSLLLIGLLTQSMVANAQARFTSRAISVKLEGTSTLHDWEMLANGKGACDGIFQVVNDKVTGIQSLTFVLPASSLKSEHSAMDKNTYKALKTDDNPNITFVMSSATVTNTGGNNYQIKCHGKLTIAGTTRETDVVATGTYNPAEKSFTIAGEKKMRMTDFDVKPPSVMLGTIKTGNDITVSYNVKLVK